MADFNIKGQVEVDDKGSLKKVEKQAGRTAKSFDRLEKSQNAYNRREKGVAQITSNSTKAFSKQAQTVRVGIVPAYAVLAANVFALTAAFNALRRAAQVEDLARGLQFVGNVAGRDLKLASERIREVTGAAVSMGDAMRTTAVGISAGFRTDQLEGLAKVAKGASIALGRDMGDALDRLTRGVAKLEPEILDELGILVRLDDAAQKYADTLGVSVQSLTRFQRQQAFLNETLTQGEKKYGDIADQLNPNAYDQLAAAVANLANSFLNFFNDTLKLSSFMNILANNTAGLAGVAGVLGASLTRQIAPAMFESAQRARQATDAFRENSKTMLGNVRTAGALPKVYLNTAKALKEGDLSAQNFSAAYVSLDKSLEAHNNQLVGYQKAVDEAGGKDEKANAALARKKRVIAEVTAERANLVKVEKGGLDVVKNSIKATNSELASQGNLIGAFRGLSDQIAVSEEKKKRYQKAQGKTAKGFNAIGRSARFAAGSIRLVGIAFLSFLPYIGLLISGVTLLYGVIKDKFFPESLVEKRIEEAKRSIENIDEITKQFQQSSATGNTRVVNAYITLNGVLLDMQTNIMNVMNASKQEIDQSKELAKTKVDEARARFMNLAAQIAEAEAAGKRTVVVGQRQTLTPYGIVPTDIVASVGELKEKLNESLETLTALKSGLRDIEIDEDNKLIETAKEQANAYLTKFQDAVKESGGFFSLVGENAIEDTKALLEDLGDTTSNLFNKKGEFQMAVFQERLKLIGEESGTVTAAFNQIDEAITSFNKNLTKARIKQQTPFDQLIASADAVSEEFNSITKQIEKVGKGNANALKAAFTELELKLEGLNIPETARESAEAFSNFRDELYRIRDGFITVEKETKKFETFSKRIATTNVGGIGQQQQQILLRDQKTSLEIQRANFRVRQLELELTEEQQKTNFELNSLKAEILEKEKSLSTEKERGLAADKDSLIIDIKRNTLAQKELTALQLQRKNQLMIANSRKGLLSSVITEAQQTALQIEQAEKSLPLEEQRIRLAAERYNIELKLAILKTETMISELDIMGPLQQAEQARIDLLKERLSMMREELLLSGKLTEAELAAARAAAEGTILQGRQGTEQAQAGLIGSVRDATGDDFFQTGPQEILKAADTSQENLKNSIKSYTEEFNRINDQAQMRAAMGVISQDKADEIVASAADRLGFEKMSAKFTAAYEASKPFFDQLRSLGPEGALAAAIGEGALLIGQSIMTIANAGATAEEKIAAVGNIITSIASIQKASSDARVAAIEKEIEAEKKRDGKSAQSKAKIKQLEAKAEAEKKKQFERDKKAKMAQTVMNTAAAIMSVWSVHAANIPLAAAMTAIIAALGAAQLATIAGTSYQGGGSGGGGGGLSSLSVGGDRQNRVDVARATSPAGEMAYMRDQRGVGNMTNFRPGGFTGRRYMAFGGYTGFMVGEQGPEMFFPDRPGTVMPADDTAEMTGGSTNVNFTINTIDSQGVEDFIFANRGEMINAIREAANSHGQGFLEGVDVLQDRDRAGAGIAFAGVSKDRR